jgi:hypothetical protein
MFRHPGRFTRLGLPIRRWAMDVEPRTLREHHGLARDTTPAQDEHAPKGQMHDGKID